MTEIKHRIIREDNIINVLLIKVVGDKALLEIENDETFDKYTNEYEIGENFFEKIEAAIKKEHGFSYKCTLANEDKIYFDIIHKFINPMRYILNRDEIKDKSDIKIKILTRKIDKMMEQDKIFEIKFPYCKSGYKMMITKRMSNMFEFLNKYLHATHNSYPKLVETIKNKMYMTINTEQEITFCNEGFRYCNWQWERY